MLYYTRSDSLFTRFGFGKKDMLSNYENKMIINYITLSLDLIFLPTGSYFIKDNLGSVRGRFLV